MITTRTTRREYQGGSGGRRRSKLGARRTLDAELAPVARTQRYCYRPASLADRAVTDFIIDMYNVLTFNSQYFVNNNSIKCVEADAASPNESAGGNGAVAPAPVPQRPVSARETSPTSALLVLIGCRQSPLMVMLW
ncbi:unnamed protein product, partial [Iphiclides podalirius]